MKILKPFYYDMFKCVGGRCLDTCCAGWHISVDEKTWDKYQVVEGELGEKLRGYIDKKEDRYFKMEGEKCPFLNKENLCEIVLQIGEKNLCEVCKSYPRMHRKIGDTVESYLTLSCP